MEKLDVEELVLLYKSCPDEPHAEAVLKAMEPLIKYWCQSQCYVQREKEDMMQVARIAVYDALRRFEVDKGIRFKTYAYRTVSGKLLNYYRDNVWQVSVPRKYRDLAPLLNKAESEFLKQKGREASESELAKILSADVNLLKETREAKNAMQAVSLSASGTDDETSTLINILGSDDNNLAAIEHKHDLKAAMEELDETERQIIYYRYFEEMTQSKVGELLNLSQMQVSRLERKALNKMREKIQD